jgi:hypothetical protein
MLTSARERLEVLKLRRAGRLGSSSSSSARQNNMAATDGSYSSTPRRGGASIIPRETQPHTTLVMDPSAKQVDYWKDIVVGRDKLLEEREALERESNRKFREEQRRILDEHVALASARRVNKPEENRQERAAVDKVFTDFVQEKHDRREHNARRQQEIREMREQQIAAKQRRLEAEQREKQEFDRLAVARAQRALEEEQHLLALQRGEAHKRGEERLEENARLKRLKLERRAAVEAEDAKALARMTEVLEQQAAVSKAEFERMKEKMRMRETIAFQRHMTLNEKAKMDEERAARLTLEREAASAKREDELKRAAKERTLKVKREVKTQAEERKAAEKEKEKIKEKEKAAAKEESESLRRIREQERAEKAAKQRACEETLRNQILEQKSRQTVVISDVERKLNSKFLPKDITTPDAAVKLPYIR